MKISQYDSERAVLKEFGNRIKQYRISLNITQHQLAEKCGLSMSTIMRIENGDDTKWTAIIKILSEFNLLENLNILIPEPQPDYKTLFEERPARKRARPDKQSSDNVWIWGDEKEDE